MESKEILRNIYERDRVHCKSVLLNTVCASILIIELGIFTAGSYKHLIIYNQWHNVKNTIVKL